MLLFHTATSNADRVCQLFMERLPLLQMNLDGRHREPPSALLYSISESSVSPNLIQRCSNCFYVMLHFSSEAEVQSL